MINLPLDCLISISDYLPNKDKVSFVSLNKTFNSIQEFIPIDIPVKSNFKSKFKLTTNIWYHNLPAPTTDKVIITKPSCKHKNNCYYCHHRCCRRNSDENIQVPEFMNNITSLTLKDNRLDSSLDTFQNLKYLEIFRLDSPVKFPTSLETLIIHRPWIHSDFNLHELINLKHYTNGGKSPDINLSNHPKLETIHLHHGLTFKVKISADKVHTNLTKLIIEDELEIESKFLPNLKYLEVDEALVDLNTFTNLERLTCLRNSSEVFKVSSLKKLKYLMFFGRGLGFDDEISPCLKELYIDRVTGTVEINDHLFPRLRRCDLNDRRDKTVVINHRNLEYLEYEMVSSLRIKNADSLGKLKYSGFELNIDDGVSLGNLEMLVLDHLGGCFDNREGVLINMGLFPKLNQIYGPRSCVRIVGRIKSLKYLQVKSGSIERIGNEMRVNEVSGDEEDVDVRGAETRYVEVISDCGETEDDDESEDEDYEYNEDYENYEDDQDDQEEEEDVGYGVHSLIYE